MKQLFLRLYLIAAMVQIFSVATHNSSADIISKYALLPLLMLHFLVNAKKNTQYFIPFLLALFFCWAGDAFLMYTDKNEQYFMFGLGAFLIGQLLYAFAFRQASDSTVKSKMPRYLYLVPVLYAGFLLALVYANLGEMIIPVKIYATAIVLMLMAAMQRSGRTNPSSFWFVLLGAKFFVISDSLIAINKFYTSFNTAAVLIMATYVIAQYLITTGVLLHEQKGDV